LLELHLIVTDGTMDNKNDAGRIRSADDVQVVDSSTNEILHQPPPYKELEQRLSSMFDFANQNIDGQNWIHPLNKAIILHFMLAYEHPFVDGNGRVSRALFYWYACKAGYWLIEYVSISSVIAEAKIEYGRSFLFVETDNSDVTYFLCNQLQTLKKAVDRLHAYVERRKAEVETFNEKLLDRKGADALNARQAYLLNEFVRQRASRITISEHEDRHSVSYLTARSDLENLTERGYLRKTKMGRVSIYRPVQNIFERMTAD
ncbi:Fic family protein, partial [Brevundimonas sp.]|uniref:Fic family protein n=1 Tax=Brevundimonas sp. TaxID=1871086 RepID=UPI00286D0C4D